MKKIKVLIVDDSELIRQVLSEIINSAPDLEVVGTAEHPLDARDKIKQLNPDVLTLDVEMPKMDGYSLTSKIRQTTGLDHLYVILHTSLSGVFNHAMVDKVGANDFIAKFEPDELAMSIQERLEAHQKQRQEQMNI